MVIVIDTTQNSFIYLALKKDNKTIKEKKIPARYHQAEVLLKEIDKLLKTQKLDKTELTGIKAANKGGSFTSLRIGALTANALAYGLGIPIFINDNNQIAKKKIKKLFNIVEPEYAREPKIG